MSGAVSHLSLQQKVSATLLTVMALLVLLSYLILNATVALAFNSMEIEGAETNLVCAKRAIRNDLDNLAAIVGDWAPWDDAYAFVRGEYPAFEKSNLDRPTLENLDLNLMLIYDTVGTLLWGQVMHDGEFAKPALLEVFEPVHPQSERLVRHNELTSRIDGLLQTALGSMMLSSRPILKSGNVGPIAGTMIMGRFFDDSRRADLRERTEVDLHWHMLDENTPLTPELRDAVVATGPDSTMHDVTDDTVASYTLLTDLFGDPWSAKALAGMGRRIVAESPGPGRGAQFSVLLPAA